MAVDGARGYGGGAGGNNIHHMLLNVGGGHVAHQAGNQVC